VIPPARPAAPRSSQAADRAPADKLLYDWVKRALDIAIAPTVLVLSLPFWVWAFFAIMLTDGWPFLYAQTRVGRNGEVFTILKFRSMIREAEKHGVPIYSQKGDPRITRVGHIMRKTAIDEIPQIISIFRGHMSWVGPRPARPEEVRQYLRDVPGYGLRHVVRPGLTGYAQVHALDYRNIEQKLRYDLYYIAHRSLWLDLTIYVKSWANTLFARWDTARTRR